MSKQIRDMTHEEINNAETLGLDDTFEFNCKACGKCCKNRSDIVLTPYDVYRIAGFFERTPEEIITRYCEVYEGEHTHIPVVWLKPVPPDNACPLLRDRKCAVHAAKPVVCRVYPLARIANSQAGNIRYYFNGASCRHEPRPIKVRDWLADVASEESEQAGLAWMNTIACVLYGIHPERMKCGRETRSRVLNDVFIAMYLNYDLKAPFAPQLERNIGLLRVHLKEKYGVSIPTAAELEELTEGEDHGS